MVRAARDDETGGWYVASSDLFGVNADADTLDDLVKMLPGIVLDLLEEGDDPPEGEVAIEVIAETSTADLVPSAA
jgi:predicted RNase H-like HicB family nuclease